MILDAYTRRRVRHVLWFTMAFAAFWTLWYFLP